MGILSAEPVRQNQTPHRRTGAHRRPGEGGDEGGRQNEVRRSEPAIAEEVEGTGVYAAMNSAITEEPGGCYDSGITEEQGATLVCLCAWGAHQAVTVLDVTQHLLVLKPRVPGQGHMASRSTTGVSERKAAHPGTHPATRQQL